MKTILKKYRLLYSMHTMQLQYGGMSVFYVRTSWVHQYVCTVYIWDVPGSYFMWNQTLVGSTLSDGCQHYYFEQSELLTCIYLNNPAATKVARTGRVKYKHVLNRWHGKKSLRTCCKTKMYHINTPSPEGRSRVLKRLYK